MLLVLTWAAGSSPRAAQTEGKLVNESSEVRWERRVGLLAGVFFVYSFGALAGGILQTRFALATALPLIAIALVVVNASVRYRHFSASLRTDA